jgi:HD superfamily phosphohydrolase
MSTHYKIFSDPIHGFINVPKGIILRLIDHPFMQRLRRIKQLGMGYLVFPGAEHTRFSHALGAMELMQVVLGSLRDKNTTISNAEYEGTLIAVLLHDIGHGPFSHTLEHTFLKDFHHEKMTLALMKRLNNEFDGALETAIQIFTNQHSKAFLHQLISSQLDIDRLDYLKRDSFYTGVYEGSVGIDRILKTMRVFKNHIVIEKKGIYAVENYILARRLMYMQVYLHKTVLGGDKLLKSIIRRARHLIDSGDSVFVASPALDFFLTQKANSFKEITNEIIDHYVLLDDNDLVLSIKYWQHSKDPILSDLSRRFLDRDLMRTTFFDNKPNAEVQLTYKERTRQALKDMKLPYDDLSLSYYLHFDRSYTEAYQYKNDSIWILQEPNKAVEFSKAADTKNIIALTKPVVKPYVVHLKTIG